MASIGQAKRSFRRMAWWAVALAVLGWIPLIAVLGVAPGAAIALGGRSFRHNHGSGRTALDRWLGGLGLVGGVLGLGWPAYFIYEAGYCPGSMRPGTARATATRPWGRRYGRLLAGWLIIVATFAAPPVLGYLGTASALHEGWTARRRSSVGTLLIVGALAASLWAEFAILVVAMAECY